jgi:hypothetical protein
MFVIGLQAVPVKIGWCRFFFDALKDPLEQVT